MTIPDHLSRLAARLRAHAADDRGYTLTELLVAMGLLTIFMGIFTTVMLMMSNSTNKVERTTNAVTQVNQAFVALDKSVRYASTIMTPGVSSSGTWHVEYDTDIYVNGALTDTCTQLRVFNSSTGVNEQLEMRTWLQNGSGYSNLSSWHTLANNVTNGTLPANSTSANVPFSIPSAGTGAASQYQQLTVTVVAASDNQTTRDTNRASMTFSGLNSTAGSTASVCQQVSVDATS